MQQAWRLVETAGVQEDLVTVGIKGRQRGVGVLRQPSQWLELPQTRCHNLDDRRDVAQFHADEAVTGERAGCEEVVPTGFEHHPRFRSTCQELFVIRDEY